MMTLGHAKTMDAKFAGKCAECGERVEAGSPILFVPGGWGRNGRKLPGRVWHRAAPCVLYESHNAHWVTRTEIEEAGGTYEEAKLFRDEMVEGGFEESGSTFSAGGSLDAALRDTPEGIAAEMWTDYGFRM